MKKNLLLFIVLLLLLAPSVMSQSGDIWLSAPEIYSQRDTFFVVSVRCDAFFKDVKSIRLDIDIDPQVLSFDTSATDPDDTIIVRPGALLNLDDTVTFFAYSLSADSTRITLDMALLSDSATINGPGQLMYLPVTTVGFGESDIIIANAYLLDRYGQPITVGLAHSWAKVCQFVGDVNADNRMDIADLVYFISWSFSSGPAPTPIEASNVNCDLYIDIADIVYMVNYMFNYGPMPCDECL